ncbi:protein of unknown function [Stigmatella aurantiaca]|uniref:Pesticidal crystal protein Cry22Aa Ig-like domain-containing protein n=1 Tax=Stigmatella aurantiaca TaxID=41 RepID=A0A1H7Z8L0_STIAU|nr:immunoglobulin-like domain-containing protein [Stigmatella aurantiaca]SEM54770.1 protein of unknown function [Stigmatella aurantiaca]
MRSVLTSPGYLLAGLLLAGGCQPAPQEDTVILQPGEVLPSETFFLGAPGDASQGGASPVFTRTALGPGLRYQLTLRGEGPWEASTALQLSVDGGHGWFRPEPVPGTPSAREPTYTVMGQGHPLAARLVRAARANSEGPLTLTLSLLSPSPRCESNSECDDDNLCTVDTCNPDGTCGHEQVLCVAGTACTPDLAPAPPPPSEDEAPVPGGDTCVDANHPSLVVNGPLDMTLECGVEAWVDPGASATDACGAVPVRTYNSGQDAYGPGPNPCAEGTYPVQYIAWNALGYTVKAIRSVRVDDRTPPTLKLKGPAFMTHPCGSQWADPGVEAFDACYGYIAPEVKWQGEVNGWIEGTYTKVYTLTDSGGNAALPVRRTVQVVNCPWK